MAYTAHGHHIPGSAPLSGPNPTNIARCGGPKMCPKCKKDVEEYFENLSEPKPQMIDHVDYALMAKKALIRYIDETSISLSGEPYEVYTVMFSKTLNTWRTFMITDMPDNIMYELIGDGKTIHVNEYMKIRNAVF